MSTDKIILELTEEEAQLVMTALMDRFRAEPLGTKLDNVLFEVTQVLYDIGVNEVKL